MDQSCLGGVAMSTKKLRIAGEEVLLESLQQKPNQLSFMLRGKPYHFALTYAADGTALMQHTNAHGATIYQTITGAPTTAHAWRLHVGAQEALVEEIHEASGAQQSASSRSAVAPMPGLVRQILVQKGEAVKAGQTLAVMEAMKLQLSLSAGADGVVKTIPVKEGELIAEGTMIVEVGDA